MATVALGTAIQRGVVASRPASGDATKAGQLYFATDEGVLYHDNGSAWLEVGRSEDGADALYLRQDDNLAALADAGDARDNLGLGTLATQDASAVSITGGSVAGISDLAIADGGTGASTAGAARTALGLAIGTDVAAASALAAHVADTANPHGVTKSQVGLGNVPNLKHNLAATTDPTTGDDTGDGYAVGSIWINTSTPEVFICADASSGAAVWISLTAGGGGASDAEDVAYDNATSGLAATDVQAAIDEVVAALGSGGSYPQSCSLWADEAKVISGTAISNQLDSNQTYYMRTIQNPAAITDVQEWHFFLAAGTYTFKVKGELGSNRAIVKWQIDGVDQITGQDWYDGTGLNDAVQSGSVTVATDGDHTLTMLVTGKNGSSSGYFMTLTKMWMYP